MFRDTGGALGKKQEADVNEDAGMPDERDLRKEQQGKLKQIVEGRLSSHV